jgi:hypothetical protein
MSPSLKAKNYAKRAEWAGDVEEKLDNIIRAILELVKAVEGLER